MEVNCKVYRREGDNMPVISFRELPPYQLKGKRRYVGKKAKLEALFRSLGVELSPELTTEQVNEYISVNVFNTSSWNKYHAVFKQVCSERNPEVECLEYQYTLNVILEDIGSIDEVENKLIYLITCELLGEPLEIYQGFKNPIVKLTKHY